MSLLPRAAELYKRQIAEGLDGNPREALKARVILRELLGGKIRLVPGEGGSLWAEYNMQPAALLRGVGSGGSGGAIHSLPAETVSQVNCVTCGARRVMLAAGDLVRRASRPVILPVLPVPPGRGAAHDIIREPVEYVAYEGGPVITTNEEFIRQMGPFPKKRNAVEWEFIRSHALGSMTINVRFDRFFADDSDRDSRPHVAGVHR